jgi:hypothetical protein
MFSIFSAIAIGLAAIMIALTIVAPFILGLFDGRETR